MVSTLVGDDTARCVAKSSAAMVLITWERLVPMAIFATYANAMLRNYRNDNMFMFSKTISAGQWLNIRDGLLLQWRRNGRDGVSNYQPNDCLFNRLFRRRSKKTSKLRVTGLCVGNSPGTGEFPAQRASNAENDSIWWRHHAYEYFYVPQRLIMPNRFDTLVFHSHVSISG